MAFTTMAGELVGGKTNFLKGILSDKPLFVRVVFVLAGLKDGASLAVHAAIRKIGHDTPLARWGFVACIALLLKVQDDCQSRIFIKNNSKAQVNNSYPSCHTVLFRKTTLMLGNIIKPLMVKKTRAVFFCHTLSVL